MNDIWIFANMTSWVFMAVNKEERGNHGRERVMVRGGGGRERDRTLVKGYS